MGAMGAQGAVATYRAVLARPGARGLFAIGFAARLPLTATAIVLTLHVALELRAGFAAAGLVGGAVTLGNAVGAPLLGRLVDRHGVRPVMVLCGLAQATFWAAAPVLGLTALGVCAAVAGLFGLPAFSVVRQSIAATTAEELRRPAFALDAMSAEVSYIVGPGLGTAAALTLGAPGSLWLVGAGSVAAAFGLGRLDPPVRDPDGAASPTRPALRGWLGLPMAVALASACTSILLLTATELGVVAALTARGETGWWALANAVWCLTSLAGGFRHGAAARPRPLPLLVALLAVGTVPVAFGGPWWLVTLLIVPAGWFCAPALAASAEAVGRLAPDGARGVATGLHGSAIMVGAAIAQPTAGALIDGVSPAAAILAAVAVTLVVAALAGLALRGR